MKQIWSLGALQRKVTRWRLRLLPYLERPSYLAFIAVVAAGNSFLPFFPVELFLILRSLARPREWWRATALAAATSSLGAMALARLVDWQPQVGLIAWLEHLLGAGRWEYVSQFVHHHGSLGLFLLTLTFLPLPPAVIMCALSKVPDWRIGLSIVVGHSLKYGFFARLAAYSPRLFGHHPTERLGILGICAVALILPSPARAVAMAHTSDYPLSARLEGPNSIFTDVVLDLAKNWPKGRGFCHYKTEPLEIQTERIPTADRPYYVGFKKCMAIHAPIAAVEAVIDDVAHYQQLFPGDKTVEIIGRDRNKTTVAWERKIPVFFVPNEKYQMSYLSVASGAKIKMYRTQLKAGDRLRFSDALVVVEANGPASTLYTDYEFYEANYRIGLFGINAVGSDEVWKESLQGSFLSLLSLRAKVEHSDWDYGHVREASEEAYQKIAVGKGAK